MDQYINTNGIRLHYVDHGGTGEVLILLHGLTANAHFFDGLIHAGLNASLHVVAVDLRGRGLSDKPDSDYSMDTHAQDILGLLDALDLPEAVIGGHSFGGLLTMYIAAKYPERVKKMVILDAGVMHPDTLDLIQPALARLGKPVSSWEIYLQAIKNSPYYTDGFWDADLEAYYRADVETLPDGSVRSYARPAAMLEAVKGGLDADWERLMPLAKQPAILLNAPEGFGVPGSPPLMTYEGAQATVQALGNCRYVQHTGHHYTMVFGKNAPAAIKAITEFLQGDFTPIRHF